MDLHCALKVLARGKPATLSCDLEHISSDLKEKAISYYSEGHLKHSCALQIIYLSYQFVVLYTVHSFREWGDQLTVAFVSHASLLVEMATLSCLILGAKIGFCVSYFVHHLFDLFRCMHFLLFQSHTLFFVADQFNCI